MDHNVQDTEVRPSLDQVGDNSSCSQSNNNVYDQCSVDKLTPLLKLRDSRDECHNEAISQSPDDGFRRQQGFTQRDMELEDVLEGNNEEQMEIRIQDEEEGDYGDFQFFHRKLLLQQHLGHNEFGIGSSVSSFGSQNGHVNMGAVDAFHVEECDDNGIGNNFSENPFVFPDNVMEYGEPQFFPGNCVGYLETILEETDEEFEDEQEEGCSGRHWWTADSDTDTDSVIRVDNSQLCNNNNQSTIQSAAPNTKLKSVENVEDLSVQSTFRSSASSRPFELEDLHLLDQLDLAFEETLMEPRRRSGFAAFGHQLSLLDQPLEKHVKLFHHDEVDGRSAFHRDGVTLKRSASHDGERTVFCCEDFIMPHSKEKASETVGKGGGSDASEKDGESRLLGNAESKETFGSSLSPSSSDSEPHEVAEEDFFYSSPGSEESEADGSSSSDDSEKNGSRVVLAEFSLTTTNRVSGFGGNNNSFSSGALFGSGNGKNGRRSLESSTSSSTASSRLKSFRSFDSLNSLSGTELLFSKADTFPSFHYIKEDVEPGSSGPGSPSSPRCNLTSCSTNDVPGVSGCTTEREATTEESQSLPSHHSSSVPGFPPTFNINKKTSSCSSSASTASSSCNSATGMIHSSENLSEDSGIGFQHELGPEGVMVLTQQNLGVKRSSAESFSDDPEQNEEGGESAKSYIAKSEFALNPLVFSSLSSSSDGGSNSPSINSVPSLNNNESPSADFSNSELKGNHGCVTVQDGESAAQHSSSVGGELLEKAVKDETRTINHNSLSNFHLGKVDESDSTQIESPQSQHSQPQLSNLKAEPVVGTVSSSIPFEHKLPISINDQPAVAVAASSFPLISASTTTGTISSHSYPSNHYGEHCSTTIKATLECGLPPNSNTEDLRISSTRTVNKVKAPPVELPDCTLDSPIFGSLTGSYSVSNQIDINPSLNSNVPLDCDPVSISQMLSTLSTLQKKEPAQHDIKRNHPDHSNSEPSLATESNISISNYNDNATVNSPSLALVKPATQILQSVQFQVGDHCQVPYSQEMEIGEEHNKPSSASTFPPPPFTSSSICHSQGGSPQQQMADQHLHNDTSANSTALKLASEYPISTSKTPNADPPKTRSRCVQRERSNSESEFECAESAVELDSIALAYAIVNSPTKQHSPSSSPTLLQRNEANIGIGDNFVGESRPTSTLSCTSAEYENVRAMRVGMQRHNMQHGQKIVHIVESSTLDKVFTSPLSSHNDDAMSGGGNTGQGRDDHAANGSSAGNTLIEPTITNWPAALGDKSVGVQNAKISLHHHQSGTVSGGLLKPDQSHSTNNINQSEIEGVAYSLISTPPPQNEALAVGQQEDNGLKPSRSVNSGVSSATDVVVHHQLEQISALNNSYDKSECGRVDKHTHFVDYIGSEGLSDEGEEGLVAAVKPIHPVHIGVAEVKKFSQLDFLAISRKVHDSHHQRGLGESESENIRLAPQQPQQRHYTQHHDDGCKSSSKTFEDEAILGQSNFGFFGRSSHPRFSACDNTNTTNGEDNLDPKSSLLYSSSVKSTHCTDSSELPSYGFPSSTNTTSFTSYPNSGNQLQPLPVVKLHSEGDHGTTEIPKETHNKRHHRDRGGPHLHLEDIKCGIHPEPFTLPLGIYSAAVLAIAPSLPCKRLTFLNERDSYGIGATVNTNINTTTEGKYSSPKLFTKGVEERLSKKSRPTNTWFNPLNGVGDSTNSSPVSYYPDVLVVKQTHSSPGSEEEGDTGAKTKEVTHTHTGPIARLSSSSANIEAMEVDTNASIRSAGSSSGDRRSTSPSGVPIKTRTYGPRNEVEVVHMSRNSRTPSPAPVVSSGSFPFSSSLKQTHPSTSSSLGEEWNNDQTNSDPPAKAPRTRVHFSPVVSEISWRESYIDQAGSEFSASTEDIVSSGQPAETGLYPTISSGANYFESDFGSSGVNGDSLLRPLQVSDLKKKEMSEVHNQVGDNPNPFRQSSPGPGKSSVLVEKVQMRSSFLQGEDEEDDDDLERKLTLNVNDSLNNRARSPVDEDHLDETDYLVEGPRKEGMQFTSGASSHSHHYQPDNGVLDLYEDVSVAIEPQTNSQNSTTLSMMPDLLSQCENAAHAQTHIDVCIEEMGSQAKSGKPPLKPKPLRKSHSPTPTQQPQVPLHSSEIPPPPMMMEMEINQQPQQQIFPKIFAEEPNGSGTFGKLGSGKSDSKNNSSSSLNKKKSGKGFSLGSGSKKTTTGDFPKERDNKHESMEKETDSSKENKTTKSSKPGFFERLSKIRLSGSKPKKQKVHPKIDELEKGLQQQPLKTQNVVNFNGNGTNGTTKSSTTAKQPTQPILKKTNHSPVIPNYTPVDYDNEPEPNESHQAFENILEEIAGIKNIQMRMDKSSSENGTPERHNPQKPPPKEMRSFAKRKQFYSTPESSSPSPPISPNGRSLSDLDRKLSQFKEDTSKNRVVISKSHPDLELIEDMVRQASISPEPLKNQHEMINKTAEPNKQSKSPESKKSPKKSHMSEAGQKNEREWYKLLKSAAEKYYYRGSKDKDDCRQEIRDTHTGMLETDLDTGASREMLDAELVELDKQVPLFTVSTSEIPSATSTGPITTMTATSPGTSTKARSLTNLSTRLPLSIAPSNFDDVDHLAPGELNDFDERAKSLEFLLDDNQKSASVPPENKLRTETRQLSEHELRIQRSLQRLNVPEWYKKHEETNNCRTSTIDRPSSGQDVDKPGGTSKLLSRRSDYGSAGGLAGGWAGLSAFKAPSMSSLQNASGVGRYSGSLNRSNFIRGRPATMSATRLSRESLTGSGSASHSPSAYDRSSFTYGMPFAMTRFGQGRMSNNSGTVTPTSTTESNASATNSSYVKKPYLGWRSQERLNALAAGTSSDGAPKLSVYLPPEERLAADLLRTRVPIRPPISDRPPLPKPPTRSEKTSLTKTSSGGNYGHTTKTNSIPPPSFDDAPTSFSSSVGRGRTSDVHDSIRQVTQAISQYVAKGEEVAPKPQMRRKSPGRQAIWMESSFVGRKPVDK